MAGRPLEEENRIRCVFEFPAVWQMAGREGSVPGK